MFLSDRDLKQAIDEGQLIVVPKPGAFDPTSIDLHLGPLEEAKIWDIEAYQRHEQSSGRDRPELRVANYKLGDFSVPYLVSPPEHHDGCDFKVCRRGNQIIVRTGGFVLWQTAEEVGTPNAATLISFVDGKSTKARTGIVVHMTAPTIHSSWVGNITLEIANFGPFDLVLQPGDVIAQLTVARITSSPLRTMSATSVTHGQTGADGKK